MVFSYYPGCTLRTKAKELDRMACDAAAALGIELREVPEWQCCGGVYPTPTDAVATRLSSVRALMAAREAGTPLVTVCSACYNVIKRVNEDMKNNEEIRNKVNNYMKNNVPYCGEVKVYHYIELLRDVVGYDELAKKVVNPLKGEKIGAYYGCLLLRPGKELMFDDPENPEAIEGLIRALGATPVKYAQRNECCGGYVTLEDRAQAEKRSGKVMSSFEEYGADSVITACPLCMYNLRKNSASSLPVIYFTELLAEALGIKDGDAE